MRRELEILKKLAIGSVFFFLPTFVFAVAITDSTTVSTLQVLGALTKGSGSFLIDHPLDPKNKLLYHSFVESPDVKNLYDGIALLDERGEATIELPSYFLALNKDFRYLATPLGEAAPRLHLKEEIDRRYFGIGGPIEFTLAGGSPGMRVSWQVTGIRHDPYILANPMVVEVEKNSDTPVRKGEYLFPEYEAYE